MQILLKAAEAGVFLLLHETAVETPTDYGVALHLPETGSPLKGGR